MYADEDAHNLRVRYCNNTALLLFRRVENETQ